MPAPLHNRVTELLGIAHPIVQASLDDMDVTGLRLAGAGRVRVERERGSR